MNTKRAIPALLLALLVPVARPGHAQEAGTPGTDATAAAAPEASAVWERLLAATAGPEDRAPITAFQLQADALTRTGVQTNETRIDYHYLAPDCIRFALPDGKVVGRSGLKARDHWLKDGEEIVPLVGRDYSEDRRQIQEMHAIAKNFVALSDPSKLRVTSLELLPEPPQSLPPDLQRTSKRLVWLRVATPDFALFLSDGKAPTERSYVVDFGLQTAGRAKDLPRYAIVREATAPENGERGGAAPMLIRLVPFEVKVFALDPRRPASFGSRAAQEVHITEANLRAPLTVESFQPGA
jgi:hypothetical protein